MQLNHLEVFCMVARLKSFSKAAKLLYLTQPGVSNHIHALENYYGTKLFNRHNHGVSLTAAGEIVYEHAVKIIDLHDNMEKLIDKVLNKYDKKLIVGASSSVGNYTLPCSIWTFKDKYPEVEISLEIANSNNIIQQVLDEKVHLAIVEGPVNNKELVCSDVFKDELILIAPPSEHWLTIDDLDITEIKKYSLIMREQGSGVRKLFEEMAKNAGIQIEDFTVITEMGSIDAIKSTVASGLGVAIVPMLSALKDIRKGDLKGIKILGSPTAINFQVIYRPDIIQTSIASRFIRFLSRPEDRSFC